MWRKWKEMQGGKTDRDGEMGESDGGQKDGRKQKGRTVRRQDVKERHEEKDKMKLRERGQIRGDRKEEDG